MPEYLAPGVFVEEVSYRSKSIEGVSTTTTGFVGPTRYGPIGVNPEVITSLTEFERTYGDGAQLAFAEDKAKHEDHVLVHNYVWHAVRAFFDNGGKRCYVARTIDLGSHVGTATGEWTLDDLKAGTTLTNTPAVPAVPANRRALDIEARWPGDAGSTNVRITLSLGPNVLRAEGTKLVPAGLRNHDVVFVGSDATKPTQGVFASVVSENSATGEIVWKFDEDNDAAPVLLSALTASGTPTPIPTVRVVTAAVAVLGSSGGSEPFVRGGLALDVNHRSGGSPDSILSTFPSDLERFPDGHRAPVTFDLTPAASDTKRPNGLILLRVLLDSAKDATPSVDVETALKSAEPTTEDQRSIDVLLSGGRDGIRPTVAAYKAENLDDLGVEDRHAHLVGLPALASIEDISIVAAPGASWDYGATAWKLQSQAIQQALIGHAERLRYRIAILDSGDQMSVGDVAEQRGSLDSRHAALYYPWVTVVDPLTRQPINLPPSGFVAGIYARNDVERAVYKAPANEVVTGAIGFETLLTTGHQEVLNPQGVNCFRYFEGRGHRLWGARTISSDPEWKYVNLRRYFAYLERSIDRGTQWAVFEPNGSRLWDNVRRTISDFLFAEYLTGAYLGAKPSESYFVKCDRSTMSQNDLDNGRLVCQIGVSVLTPAEFVIFRVGQWTADRKS